MKKLILVIAVFAPFWASASDDWDFSMKYKNQCSSGGQQQMNICLAKAYRSVDERLNEVYNELKNKMKRAGTDLNSLVKAQRAWIEFRDLECEFSSPPHSGSLYSFSQNACLINLTAKRIKDFERYLSWGGCNGCRW